MYDFAFSLKSYLHERIAYGPFKNFIDLNKLNLAVKSYLNNVARWEWQMDHYGICTRSLFIFLRPLPKPKKKIYTRRIMAAVL